MPGCSRLKKRSHVTSVCYGLFQSVLTFIEGSKESQPIGILQKFNKNHNDILFIFRLNKWHIAKWLCSLEVFFPLSFVVSKVWRPFFQIFCNYFSIFESPKKKLKTLQICLSPTVQKFSPNKSTNSLKASSKFKPATP
jgi:hypothetical protein